jgi:sporulation protein YabP
MEEKKTQNLIIKSRESFNCDAVTDVEEFSEEFVIINTQYGKLSLEGEALRIKELNEKEGKICVTGKISGILFRDENEKSGFFKRRK